MCCCVVCRTVILVKAPVVQAVYIFIVLKLEIEYTKGFVLSADSGSYRSLAYPLSTSKKDPRE